MLITIYDSTGTHKADLSPNDSSTQVKEIQGDSILTLSFTHHDHISLDVDDYVDFEGERFWLTEKYRPRQNTRKEWVYDIKLYGVESMLKRLIVIKTVDDEDDPVFTLTAPPHEHVAMIVKCMNNGLGNITDWKVGQVDGTENIVIDYFGKYCDEALKEIAEKVGAEAWVEGQTVNICKCEHGEPIPMGYDKGLLSIDPGTADNVKFYTRLYPVGSSRNIDREKYGYSRLQLPGGQKYVEINADKYGRVDHYEADAFADIYPRRTGIVSNVRSEVKTGEDGNPFTIFYFSDNSLPFDPNDYEISGLVKRVSFQEGSELAGLGDEENGTYYFEVNFNSRSQEFEIITIWPYGDEMQLPGDKLIPKIGDKYILWNLRMPDEYYELAEAEFMSAVDKYNADHNLDISVYKAPTDHVWIEDNEVVLTIGQRIRLESDEYFPETGYRDSRITKITRKVNLPSSMDIEISDALSRTSLQKVTDSISEVKSYAQAIGESISLPDIIKTGDRTRWTDNNLLSALRIATEFISKLKDDRTRGLLASDKGFDVGEFLSGISGGRLAKDSETGQTFLEVDRIYARVRAFFETLTMVEASTLGGKMYINPGGSVKCTSVEETENSYKCFFLTEQDGVRSDSKFVVGDQVIAESFNIDGSSDKVKNHRFWRLVVGVSNDSYSDENGNRYGHIELSKSDCESDSDEPQAGDIINQFGNRSQKSRQSAMILSTVDNDSPCVKLLIGIGSGSSESEWYSLSGKDILSYGYDPISGKPYFRCYGDHYIGSKDGHVFVRYNGDENTFDFQNVSQIVTSMSNGVAKVLSGINGVYSLELGDRTIGTWWGGDMIDLFDKHGQPVVPVPKNAATSLVRLDGSVYWAKGNFGFETDGRGWLGNYLTGLRVDASGKITLGSGITVDLNGGVAGLKETLESLLNFNAGIAHLLEPCDANGEPLKGGWAEATQSDGAGGIRAKSLKAKVGFWGEQWISTLGISPGSGTGGGSGIFGLMREWPTIAPDKTTDDALGANLGWELKQRIDNLPTTSVNPFSLTIQKNGVTLGTYDGSVAKTINLSDVASANALAAHTSDTTVHITADERTKWNNTATNLSAILGSNTDDIINKWDEIVAFLDTYTEADTLANLLSNKADKATTLAGYGITDAYTKSAADGRFLKLAGGTMANTNVVTNLNADLLDGLHNGELTAKWLALQDTRSADTLPNALGKSVSYHFKFNTTDGLASGGTYHSVLHFAQWAAGDNSGGYAKQLAFGDNGRMYLRHASMSATSWNEWRTIAFLTDNVASASRLQTTDTFTAWGQTYFENGVPKNVDGVFRELIAGSLNGGVAHSILNNSAAPYGLVTRIYGNGSVSLQAQRETTTNEWFSLILNPSGGNVGVGVAPAYKFDVAGDVRSTSQFLRTGITGSSWNNGAGAYNVEITDNSSQTPLMVAYRAGQTPAVTGADRLFAMEFLNSGTLLRFCFGGAEQMSLSNTGLLTLKSLKIGECIFSYDETNGAIHISSPLYSDKWITALGSGGVSGGGSSGGGVDILQEWGQYNSGTSKQTALSAYLGYDLLQRQSQLVTLTTEQSVSGVKDFTNSIKLRNVFADPDMDYILGWAGSVYGDVTYFTPATLREKLEVPSLTEVDARLAGYVSKSGAETISGMKNFAGGAKFVGGNDGLGFKGGVDGELILNQHIGSTVNEVGRVDIDGYMTMKAFIKNGASGTQFLMGDGSVNSRVDKNGPGSLGWVNLTTNSKQIPSIALLAYWDGAYAGTSSNLKYCWRGLFGTMSTETATDYLKRSGGSMTTADVVTSLNADMLDGVHLAGKGGVAGVMRSWNRGGFTDLDDFYGNGNVVVFDPKPVSATSDAQGVTHSMNTILLSLGDMASRNTQIVFPYDKDEVMYRRNYGTAWSNWRQFAFLDSTVAKAKKLANVCYLWGQWFDGNGLEIKGALQNVGNVIPEGHGEAHIGAWSNHFADIAAGEHYSRLDSPLIIRQYKAQPIEFYTNAVKRLTITEHGDILFGGITFRWDAANQCLRVIGAGVVVEEWMTTLKKKEE
ncbi:MAG: hypothetical protein K2M07_06835 [Muribaculaceae bacterium]|nr:hypothetical protein [Muribaculaceae bacterium]